MPHAIFATIILLRANARSGKQLGFAQPTKEKTADAIFSFVAHPPPGNEKAFENNKGISGNLRKYMLQLENETDTGTNRRLTWVWRKRGIASLENTCKTASYVARGKFV